MAPAWLRVHHSAPSGPAVISEGMLPAGSGNSSLPPSRLIQPIRSAATRVYQSVRPGPAHKPYGEPSGVSTGTEETVPSGWVLPIRPSPRLNQIASSGPRASTMGRLGPGIQADPADLPVRADPGELAAPGQAGPRRIVGGQGDAVGARSDVVFGHEHCVLLTDSQPAFLSQRHRR